MGSANKCIQLDENLINTIFIPKYGPMNTNLIYNAYNGLVMEVNFDSTCPCCFPENNQYYHLARRNDDGESMYEWKRIGDQIKFFHRSLMCNVNENIFFWK